MKRKLNKDETIIVTKQLCRFKENEAIAKGMLKKVNFKLDFDIDFQSKINKREMHTKKRQYEEELTEIQRKIKILTTQMTEGVEVKEVKKESNEVKENGNDEKSE